MAVQEFTTEELSNEIWKPLPEWEDIYQISSLGRVRRIKDTYFRRYKSGYILNPTLDTYYLVVSLSRNGKSEPYYVHDLVTAAFIGKKPKGFHVNHMNAIREDNRITNLEYVTAAENHKHAARMGRMATGTKHGSKTHPERVMRGSTHCFAKLTEEKVKAIREEYSGSYTAIAHRYGVSAATVRNAILRQTWKHVI